MTELPAVPALPLDLAAPEVALGALLLGGHLLGDFAFQTRWMVEGKPRPLPLFAHGLVVALVHLGVLIPFFGLPVVLAAGGIGAVHAGIDLVKAGLRRRSAGSGAGTASGSGSAPLALFLVDQAAHLLVLAVAFVALRDHAWPLPLQVPAPWLGPWATAGLVAGAFAFAWHGGGALVSGVLATLSPGLEEKEDASSGVEGSGRLIGKLERTIALVLILFGQWAALVLLVAAKSIARFEELKERRFAEYYLVGTLSSLLVAIVVGLALSFALFGGMR
ncbi:MAG: DUF3307 domain-containing protein [Gemmatimonadetes bacterium]|nr:DUF3307 domain-containing protein [Gemmatimonadota bacterium]NIR77190.1 DUF3307 domain-containing protein [Gemmatimonadota bacterium]NIT85706.1 DUF3307 domain-containing protein [Gemmatimonadota bacterium]NIU29536.1 DUF3307 domain-containing protein [Gemmatimonadota bacterium]NIU34583.1 DUF3307 domain-containing protein [Gemmatimonadota bacterium]